MRRMDRQDCCGQQELRWRLGVRREELLPRAAGAVTSGVRRRCCAGDTVPGSRTQDGRRRCLLWSQETLLRVANSRARHVQETALRAAGAAAPCGRPHTAVGGRLHRAAEQKMWHGGRPLRDVVACCTTPGVTSSVGTCQFVAVSGAVDGTAIFLDSEVPGIR